MFEAIELALIITATIGTMYAVISLANTYLITFMPSPLVTILILCLVISVILRWFRR